MRAAAEPEPPRGADPEMLELAREECLELLASHTFGRVAVASGGEAPVIRPVNYVFDHRSQAVAFRTARGSKFHALIHSATSAFEIDEVDPVSRTGWSVIIRGVTEEVVNPLEVRHLEELGLDSWPPGERSHWVRIRAGVVSGRRIAESGGRGGSD